MDRAGVGRGDVARSVTFRWLFIGSCGDVDECGIGEVGGFSLLIDCDAVVFGGCGGDTDLAVRMSRNIVISGKWSPSLWLCLTVI